MSVTRPSTATSVGTNVSPSVVDYCVSAAGDQLLLLTGFKPVVRNFSDPTGWAFGGSAEGGYDEPTGTDVGMTEVRWHSRVADGTETGQLSITWASGSTPNPGFHAMLALRKTSPGNWSLAAAYGQDADKSTTGAGAFTALATADPGYRANDVAVIWVDSPSDNGTITNPVLTIPGCTLGPVTVEVLLQTVAGNDGSFLVCTVPVLTGTSTGAPTFAYDTTDGRNSHGTVGFLRVREIAAVEVWDGAATVVAPIEGIYQGVDPMTPVVEVEVYEPTSVESLTSAGGMTGDAQIDYDANGVKSKTNGTKAKATRSAFLQLDTVPATWRCSAIMRVPTSLDGEVEFGMATDTTLAVQLGAKILATSTTVTFSMTHMSQSPGTTSVSGATLVRGTEYLVSLAYTDMGDGAGAITCTVTASDGTPFYTGTMPTERHYPAAYGTAYVTTSVNEGCIRDLAIDEHFLAWSSRPRPYRVHTTSRLDVTNQTGLWGWKGGPPKVVFLMGGSGATGVGYNGPAGFLEAGGGLWGAQARANILGVWKALTDAGYLVVAPEAYSENWGSDRALAEYVDVYNELTGYFGAAPEVHLVAYSMGGVTAWRSIIGRNSFPVVKAAVIVAGITDMNYSTSTYPRLAEEWPDPNLYDHPTSMNIETIVGRGTRVLMITSEVEGNVPKTKHDAMFTLLKASTRPDRFSEHVHLAAEDVTHFDPEYWNAARIMAHIEG